MPLNIGASGRIAAYVKFNAKSDKWFVRGEDGDEEIARPTFVADLANIATGWLRFREGVSDVSVPGTNWAVFVREDFWLIVETEGNEDEAEIHDIERPGREGCTGHSAQDASQIFL